MVAFAKRRGNPRLFWREKLISILNKQWLGDISGHLNPDHMTREYLEQYVLANWDQTQVENLVFGILLHTADASDPQVEYMALSKEEAETIRALRKGAAKVRLPGH